VVEVSGKVGRHFPFYKIVNATSALLSAIDTYVQNGSEYPGYYFTFVEMVYHRLTDGIYDSSARAMKSRQTNRILETLEFSVCVQDSNRSRNNNNFPRITTSPP
jgi:hypothetical protein